MSIPVIDPQKFRLIVAGLVDPNARPTGQAEQLSIKEEAVQLCLILCELFSDQLDRLTLWDKIGSALKSAAGKISDGDTDLFASLCLESVKADDAKAARHDGFSSWVSTMSTRDDAFRQAFIRYCGVKTPILLVFARQKWEQRKIDKKATKGGVE